MKVGCFFAFVKSRNRVSIKTYAYRNIALRVRISYSRFGSQEPLILYTMESGFTAEVNKIYQLFGQSGTIESQLQTKLWFNLIVLFV